jgi:hypothetical protein
LRDHIEVLYQCILKPFPQDFHISYTACHLISGSLVWCQFSLGKVEVSVPEWYYC